MKRDAKRHDETFVNLVEEREDPYEIYMKEIVNKYESPTFRLVSGLDAAGDNAAGKGKHFHLITKYLSEIRNFNIGLFLRRPPSHPHRQTL